MMDRRVFIGSSAAAAAFAAMTPLHGSPRKLRHGIRIDSLTIDRPNFDAEAALAAGINSAVVDLSMYPRTYANATDALEQWQTAFNTSGSRLLQVQTGADIQKAVDQDKFGVILACQDASILEVPTISVSDFNLDNLKHFYDLGLRVLQMSHNERTGVGDGYRERIDGGLSLLGEAVVSRMNTLGMLVDVSHCSDLTTLQAIRLSKRPAAVTHAGCRALYPTKRNKPDEVIRALADHGGYFGIFNVSVWLAKGPGVTVDAVVDHIDHVVKIGGLDLAGFGSDHLVLGDNRSQADKTEEMDSYRKRNPGMPGSEPTYGQATIPELDTADRLNRLAFALSRRGYKAAAVDKILGGNFTRVFTAAVG